MISVQNDVCFARKLQTGVAQIRVFFNMNFCAKKKQFDEGNVETIASHVRSARWVHFWGQPLAAKKFTSDKLKSVRYGHKSWATKK